MHLAKYGYQGTTRPHSTPHPEGLLGVGIFLAAGLFCSNTTDPKFSQGSLLTPPV